MKYCPFCGVGLQDEMVFCPKCGERFQDAVEDTQTTSAVPQSVPSHGSGATANVATAARPTKGLRTLIVALVCLAVIAGAIAMVWKAPHTQENPTPSPVEAAEVTASEPPAEETVSMAQTAESVLYPEVYDENEETLTAEPAPTPTPAPTPAPTPTVQANPAFDGEWVAQACDAAGNLMDRTEPDDTKQTIHINTSDRTIYSTFRSGEHATTGVTFVFEVTGSHAIRYIWGGGVNSSVLELRSDGTILQTDYYGETVLGYCLLQRAS